MQDLRPETPVDYSGSTPDVTRTYDLAGRPATMTDGAGGTVSYGHDDADRWNVRGQVLHGHIPMPQDLTLKCRR